MSREVIVLNDHEESEDEQEKKQQELLKKLNEQSRYVNPVGTYVYVLNVESWNHSANYQCPPENITVGIFDSKDAAVAMSGSYDSSGYGTFDEALIEFHNDYEEGDAIDNRDSPPDDGILIQVGNEDTGMGDYCRLLISKVPLLGFTEKHNSKAQHVTKKRRSPEYKLGELCY